MDNHFFDQVIDRKHSNSVKWDGTKRVFGVEDVLPMWVADMDFKAPPQVLKAIQTRVEHGIFGYSEPPLSTKKAIQKWMNNRHHWNIRDSWITYSSGIVPALATAIEAYTKPGDKVMMQTPVYPPFFDLVIKNDRIPVYHSFDLDDGKFEINFDKLEQLIDKQTKLFFLCNPHNPGGKVWTKGELTKLGEICSLHNITIISDEIHSDIILAGTHIPIASIDDKFAQQTITCIAPSKTFNLAGLQTAAIITPNTKLRLAFQKVQQRQGFYTVNALGMVAMEAAYQYGEVWLKSLIAYLQENIMIVDRYLKQHLPSLKMIKPDASYLIWIDCRSLHMTDEQLKRELLDEGKLALEPGSKFGIAGNGFVRMNIGCPKQTLYDGLDRLKKALG
ncbi:MalY/PatB family protein [Cytobacillus sp. IB215665]|uniref:MalY/PatB family protein n=1 Tax=Cytobacillus sp. IB215665 TaxID=3097357 RepID=UPI002A10C657|nr:MalY/PatB family protein [Cytobacillus sp. IB215665]MDX8365895.1 MalY/PatB family protein [Cytobacillus sp. IB215665]